MTKTLVEEKESTSIEQLIPKKKASPPEAQPKQQKPILLWSFCIAALCFSFFSLMRMQQLSTRVEGLQQFIEMHYTPLAPTTQEVIEPLEPDERFMRVASLL